MLRSVRGKMLVLFSVMGIMVSGCGTEKVNDVVEIRESVETKERDAASVTLTVQETVEVTTLETDNEAEGFSGERVGQPGRDGGFWERLNISENTWITETERITEDYTADDAAVVFHYEADRFTVTNSGNPEAAKRVMDFLEKRTTDVAVMAKDAEVFYEDSREKENINFYEQDYEENYSAVQVNGYLSVIAGAGGYLGGAHGFYNEVAWVFDPDGNRVRLEDLFRDVDAVQAVVVEELKAQIEEMDHTLFYDKETYEPFLKDLFCEENDTWYLSENGIEIIANQYMIAPYVSGTIYFTIPYDSVAK